MNRSHTLPLTAASAAAAAALLLSGCGGDGDDDGGGKDRIAGAETGSGAPSDSARADRSDAPKIDRPKMTLPRDVSLVFDQATTTGPDQTAAVNDARNFVRSIRYGIVEQDADDSAYKFYSELQSPAQSYAKDQIKQRVDKGLSISGEMRFTRTKVSEAENKKSAVVSFCSDSSKLFSKEVKTEKVHHTEPSISDYYSWQVLMKPSKNTNGLWRAHKVQVKEKAGECR
ncbi:hypothetical protein [Streptomyces sp. NPDC047123]|uniref:hypothetical protein n=1 Tax=Streptomyces sp. NPDC047123 TaxID=3155622 RepID=UPI0033EB8FE2